MSLISAVKRYSALGSKSIRPMDLVRSSRFRKLICYIPVLIHPLNMHHSCSAYPIPSINIFAKYISEFDIIPESLKDKRVEEVDRTPAENLAYQVGWTTLVIKWESDERKGIHVKTPSDNFKWNQLGELYQWFTDTYAHLSLQELKDMLNENINSIYEIIDSLSDEELFEPHMRKWADESTKTAVWEVYKFIHVNTVAPFGTFRTKIRKWKKIAL